MPQGFRTPLDWMNEAMSSVIVIFIIHSMCISLGTKAGSDEGSIGILFLILSIANPMGLWLAPLNIYVLWSLIMEKHNPYLLLSMTVVLSFIISASDAEFGPDFNNWTIPILAIPFYVIFTGWFTPVKNFLIQVSEWKKNKISK